MSALKLHWHRWRTRAGVAYHLSTEPWHGDETARRLTGELAGVYYLTSSKRWRYDVQQHGRMPSSWGLVGSPIRARRLVETYILHKSGAAFDLDPSDIEFVQLPNR